MAKDRTVIEFWATRKVGVKASFIISIETEAPPPPVDSIVNIRSEDYLVLAVDYSIDQPGQPFPEKIYRRNVIMVLKDAS